ncbi:MAG: amylo-alpha-1,6-glucosidase, partial [Fimbriimonadales bacterium]
MRVSPVAVALATLAIPALATVSVLPMSRRTMSYDTAKLAELEAVPYLGPEEPYFLGSGVAGAGGDTEGKWDFLIGPDYTSPNFISEETLSLTVDGRPTALAFKMHRARETGIFFGSQRIGDLRILVADFSNSDSPWVARLIGIENLSRKTTARVSVRATIRPGGTRSNLEGTGALAIEADRGVFCFGGETRNWAKRVSLITFSDLCVAKPTGAAVELTTSEHTVAPGRGFSTGLYHHQFYAGEETPKFLIDKIRRHNPEADLERSIAYWGKWLRSGKSFEKKATDQRAWDAVEASLLACKMQQNRDGGTIAGTRRYANSYIRDTHGAVRLFLATGHYPEAKKAIETIHHKWSVAGFIPNYWSMGSDSFLGRSFVNDSAEITGYYVLMIRDYYAATKDIKFVDSLAPSIKFAVDSQLDFMARNEWRITFNGDETEQYCVRQDGQEYGGFPAFPQWRRDSWSFPSAALACASTQFYIDYLLAEGNRAGASLYETKLAKARDGIDATFWKAGAAGSFHYWARYKDGSWPDVMVPNYGLLPLWIGARLNKERQLGDATAMRRYVVPESGYLPTAPDVV